MAAEGFRWVSPPSMIAVNLERYRDKALEAMEMLGNYFAAQMEAHMKRTAGWQDRTGAARQSLRSFAMRVAAGIVIYLTIGVEYGPHLLLGTSRSRPFPVIQDTMALFHAPIMRAARQMVGG